MKYKSIIKVANVRRKSKMQLLENLTNNLSHSNDEIKVYAFIRTIGDR